MRRITFLTIILSLFNAVSALGQAGSGPRQYSVDVKDFSELVVIDGINVDYRCNADSAGWATFYASPERSSQIMFEANNGKLKIQLPMRDMQITDVPRVTVYSRYLASVENDGDSLVRVLSVAPGPKFKAKLVGNGRLSIRDIDVNEATISILTGNGQINVTGRCNKASLRITGTGSIIADDLEADKVDCRLTGTGTIGCAPSTSLSIKGVGSGTILYSGNPEISRREIGLHVERLVKD